MLFDVFDGSDNGVDIRYPHWRLCLQPQKTSSKDQGEDWYRQRVSVHLWQCTELYYKSQHAKQRWQVLMACDNFGRMISPKKTEVMHQLAPRKPYVEPNITIKRKRLGRKVHLPWQHPKSIVMDDQLNARLVKASAAFGPTKQECVESERYLGSNQNQVIPSCRSYHLSLCQWNVDILSTAYKEA